MHCPTEQCWTGIGNYVRDGQGLHASQEHKSHGQRRMPRSKIFRTARSLTPGAWLRVSFVEAEPWVYGGGDPDPRTRHWTKYSHLQCAGRRCVAAVAVSQPGSAGGCRAV